MRRERAHKLPHRSWRGGAESYARAFSPGVRFYAVELVSCVSLFCHRLNAAASAKPKPSLKAQRLRQAVESLRLLPLAVLKEPDAVTVDALTGRRRRVVFTNHISHTSKSQYPRHRSSAALMRSNGCRRQLSQS